MQPLNLLGIEMAITGILPSVDWETTTQHSEEYRRDIFSRANNIIHTGRTYAIELPPDADVSESKHVAAEAPLVIQEIVKDSLGELLMIESWVTKIAPASLPDLPLVSTTLGERRSMEHRAGQNGTHSREVFFPVRQPAGSENFVRLVYHGLSQERAAAADRIIETIEEKSWD